MTWPDVTWRGTLMVCLYTRSTSQNSIYTPFFFLLYTWGEECYIYVSFQDEHQPSVRCSLARRPHRSIDHQQPRIIQNRKVSPPFPHVAFYHVTDVHPFNSNALSVLITERNENGPNVGGDASNSTLLSFIPSSLDATYVSYWPPSPQLLLPADVVI